MEHRKSQLSEQCTEKNSTSTIVTVDYERYAHFLSDSDLSHEEKQAFLDAIWNIILGFIDLGFGVHPIQQADKACGKVNKSVAPSASGSKKAVEYRHTMIEQFINSADEMREMAGEESE